MTTRRDCQTPRGHSNTFVALTCVHLACPSTCLAKAHILAEARTEPTLRHAADEVHQPCGRYQSVDGRHRWFLRTPCSLMASGSATILHATLTYPTAYKVAAMRRPIKTTKTSELRKVRLSRTTFGQGPIAPQISSNPTNSHPPLRTTGHP